MSAVDAQMYWMSAKIPNDQFLLYCFTTPQLDVLDIANLVVEKSFGIPDLCVRVRELPFTVDYPRWVRSTPSRSNVVVHQSSQTWTHTVDAVAGLGTQPVDAAESPWRIHLFSNVSGAPGFRDDAAIVVVLQISHALADGARSSDIARGLFGGRAPPAVSGGADPLQLPALMWTGFLAHRAQQKLDRDTACGAVPPSAPGRALTATNASPGRERQIRMTVCDASDLRAAGVSVTVGALTVVSIALSEWLVASGVSVPAELGAEVLIASTPDNGQRNNFRNAGVDLHPFEPDLRTRAHKIGRSLDERRQRAAHPAGVASDRAMRHVPAALLHWGVGKFDTSVIPDCVSGNTVVSSVMRGAADLELGGGSARFTAGFPALSPAMGLTHGVHGLGNSVTVSVHASPDVVHDIDRYNDLIRDAIRQVRHALH